MTTRIQPWTEPELMDREHLFEASVEKFERDSTNDLTDFEEARAFLRFAWRDRLGATEVL